MRGRRMNVALVLMALAWVAPGCVAKKAYQKDTAKTNERISSAEDSIEANEKRVADLAAETDAKLGRVEQKTDQAAQTGNQALGAAREAGATAQAAQRAALGKVLWEVTLSNDQVRFSFNQASVPDSAAVVLDDLAAKVKAYGKAVYVEVEGHTDSVGAEDYNLALGEKRAQAVRDYLAAEGGLPLHIINVISYGESKPTANNGTPDGRATNRRVVVRVLE